MQGLGQLAQIATLADEHVLVGEVGHSDGRSAAEVVKEPEGKAYFSFMALVSELFPNFLLNFFFNFLLINVRGIDILIIVHFFNLRFLRRRHLLIIRTMLYVLHHT